MGAILKDKNKRIALIGTVLFHALLLLILLSFYLEPPYPPRPEIGLEVNLGNSDDGVGAVQPETPQETVATPPPTPQEVTNTEHVVTQEQEKTVQVNNKPKAEKPQPKVEKPQEEPKPQIDDRFVFKKKDKTKGGSEGKTGKPGDQGRENGTPDATNYVGDGGGNGISFYLKGRKSKRLPKPVYDSEEQGTVIVKVWVNQSGKVINAVVQEKGTTTADSRLRDMAVKAAKEAVFDANPDAPEVQTGTITYDFILLN